MAAANLDTAVSTRVAGQSESGESTNELASDQSSRPCRRNHHAGGGGMRAVDHHVKQQLGDCNVGGRRWRHERANRRGQGGGPAQRHRARRPTGRTTARSSAASPPSTGSRSPRPTPSGNSQDEVNAISRRRRPARLTSSTSAWRSRWPTPRCSPPTRWRPGTTSCRARRSRPACGSRTTAATCPSATTRAKVPGGTISSMQDLLGVRLQGQGRSQRRPDQGQRRAQRRHDGLDSPMAARLTTSARASTSSTS